MVKVEICCGSFEDALQAQAGGADRIELNDALYLGGLTPTLGSLMLTKQVCTLPVICMVRPRGAGFCYSENEKKVMFADAKCLLEHQADGIAFGFLNDDCTLDEPTIQQMVELIHSYGKEAVFHRAFDCVKNPYIAIETLIRLHVDRILTSGCEATAMEGKALIFDLQQKYGTQIEILAGSGVKAHNVVSLLKETQIKQVHSSAKAWKIDPTTSANHVSYAYHEANDYDVVDQRYVQEIIEEVKKIND